MNARPSHPVTAPTGLRRVDAAKHWAVSPAHFDRLVKERIAPQPRDLGGVKVWVRQELDDALFALPPIGEEGGGNSCDQAFGL